MPRVRSPIKGDLYRGSLLNFWCVRPAYFSVRDTYSLETLKSAGINVSKIRLEVDLAFKYPIRRKRLVLTLVPLSPENLKELAALIFDFTQTSGENWLILCLPFCLQHNYDLETIERFTLTCCSHEYNIMLADNREYCKLSKEKRTTIDIDLCEF